MQRYINWNIIRNSLNAAAKNENFEEKTIILLLYGMDDWLFMKAYVYV